MIMIDDPEMPGLSRLDRECLNRITGSIETILLRLRYREGKRAILHIGMEDLEGHRQGTLWLFKGDKAKRLAKRNPAARFDTATLALYEAFPNDHRMPQIRKFLNGYDTIAPALLNEEPAGEPELLRYRPGLSCTFRCMTVRNGAVYVKLINDDDPERLLAANRAMDAALAGTSVSIAPAVGHDPTVSAIAYASAPGKPLDRVMSKSLTLGPMHQAIAALRQFSSISVVPERQMNPQVLLSRARESANMVRLIVPDCKPAVSAILSRLQTGLPQVSCLPIHGDIKLEHLFLDADRTVLIDTESVSSGPPDYDLAQLYGRLWQAELEGLFPRQKAVAAGNVVRAAAGPSFAWCLDVVAIRLAKYYAQRPSPEMSAQINAILERLAP